MTTHKTASGRLRAWLTRAGVLTLVAAAIAACNNFLTAKNPGAVEEQNVNNPAYVNLIANEPVFGFQDAQDDVTYWNGQFTDELYNRAVFVEEGQIDRRELYSDMTYINAFMYAPMQRARYAGDDAARRLKAILGDTASRDIRVARSLAYAAYSYIYLGEMECATPIDLSAPKSWDEMMTEAISRFQEAITIATAAKAYLSSLPNPNANAIAATDSVRYFALVGAARASLDKNDKANAITFASQVPASFEFRAYYTNNTTTQLDRTYERLTLGKNAYMLNTPFAAMAGDPRVPRITGTTTNATTPLCPESYSCWNNTPVGTDFTPNVSVRVASGLEARYIVAEAQGPTAATLALVNERRAVGLQSPVNLTGDALMAELRDQRSRDFYLDNHRLGDLRRYKRFYGVDLFPKGPYPGSTSGQVYSESPATLTTASDCWPLPTNEINNNPNVPRG